MKDEMSDEKINEMAKALSDFVDCFPWEWRSRPRCGASTEEATVGVAVDFILLAINVNSTGQARGIRKSLLASLVAAYVITTGQARGIW